MISSHGQTNKLSATKWGISDFDRCVFCLQVVGRNEFLLLLPGQGGGAVSDVSGAQPGFSCDPV